LHAAARAFDTGPFFGRAGEKIRWEAVFTQKPPKEPIEIRLPTAIRYMMITMK
jgi:hypothetical protein